MSVSNTSCSLMCRSGVVSRPSVIIGIGCFIPELYNINKRLTKDLLKEVLYLVTVLT